MTNKEKIYFNTTSDDWGILFTAKSKHNVNLNIRLAWRPKFLLKKYQDKYWEIAGIAMYKDLLDILSDIWADGFSPIVWYLWNNK